MLHAEKVRIRHGSSIGFHLGTLAATIQKRFLRMLKMYRKYADLEMFKKESYSIWEIFNAYQIIQGDYNEIRFDQALYYEIIRRHESEEAAKTAHTSSKTKSKSRGRRLMTWRPNTPPQDVPYV